MFLVVKRRSKILKLLFAGIAVAVELLESI
jgi:hypothetical protein